MGLKEFYLKKPARFLTLLLTATLMASVSATVYYSLNMQSTTTVGQTPVIFEQGNDWGNLEAGSILGTNSTHAHLALEAYPNVTMTYEEPLNISHVKSGNKEVRLRHISISPASGSASVSNFTFINFTLNGVDFDYSTTGDTWNTPSDMVYQTIPGNTEWILRIEIKAAAGASASTTCTLTIALDVKP